MKCTLQYENTRLREYLSRVTNGQAEGLCQHLRYEQISFSEFAGAIDKFLLYLPRVYSDKEVSTLIEEHLCSLDYTLKIVPSTNPFTVLAENSILQHSVQFINQRNTILISVYLNLK